MQLDCFETKLPNLKLKTQPIQLLDYIPLAIALSLIEEPRDVHYS